MESIVRVALMDSLVELCRVNVAGSGNINESM